MLSLLSLLHQLMYQIYLNLSILYFFEGTFSLDSEIDIVPLNLINSKMEYYVSSNWKSPN